MSLRIRIERLVLEGLPIGKAGSEAMADAFREELARSLPPDLAALAARGNRRLDSLQGEPLRLGASMSATRTGADVGRSIHRVLAEEPSSREFGTRP